VNCGMSDVVEYSFCYKCKSRIEVIKPFILGVLMEKDVGDGTWKTEKQKFL
jgi:hypothetical protein